MVLMQAGEKNNPQIIKVKGIPKSTKQKLRNIANKKGVTLSQYLRFQLAQLPDVPTPETTGVTEIKIHSLPPATRQKLERIAAARPAGGTVQDVIRDEFNRIMRETPAYLMREGNNGG